MCQNMVLNMVISMVKNMVLNMVISMVISMVEHPSTHLANITRKNGDFLIKPSIVFFKKYN